MVSAAAASAEWHVFDLAPETPNEAKKDGQSRRPAIAQALPLIGSRLWIPLSPRIPISIATWLLAAMQLGLYRWLPR
jgi:hypothetical protein